MTLFWTRVAVWAGILRHLARMPELKIFGIDKNTWALRETAKSMETMPDALSKDYLVSIADINKLPFADASFDCIICSEVLEHIPDHKNAIKELDRILKPHGTLVVSVPRYFAERICWFISRDYYNEEGGHIRIYRKKNLRKMLTNQGFKCWRINYKHALHSPYWWLKCLVGLKNEEHPLVKNYQKVFGMGYYEKTATGADTGRIVKSANGQEHRLLS